MNIDVKFEELSQEFKADFGEVVTASDGGYERGYAEGYERGELAGYGNGHEAGYAEGYSKGESVGYENGEAAGYSKGHADGLAERTHETWTITLVDGSTVEKEVAML